MIFAQLKKGRHSRHSHHNAHGIRVSVVMACCDGLQGHHKWNFRLAEISVFGAYLPIVGLT